MLSRGYNFTTVSSNMIKSTHMKHIYWRSLISASFKYCIKLGILFLNIPFLQPNEMTDLRLGIVIFDMLTLFYVRLRLIWNSIFQHLLPKVKCLSFWSVVRPFRKTINYWIYSFSEALKSIFIKKFCKRQVTVIPKIGSRIFLLNLYLVFYEFLIIWS